MLYERLLYECGHLQARVLSMHGTHRHVGQAHLTLCLHAQGHNLYESCSRIKHMPWHERDAHVSCAQRHNVHNNTKQGNACVCKCVCCMQFTVSEGAGEGAAR